MTDLAHHPRGKETFDWKRKKFRYVFHGGPLDGKVKWVQMQGTCFLYNAVGLVPGSRWTTVSYTYGKCRGKATIDMMYAGIYR